jgi:SAM-dependent methyltransferase
MQSTTTLEGEIASDRAKTLRNRSRLQRNANLLFWYRQLYYEQFKDFRDPQTMSILEVGSGTSPLKSFYPNVLASDVLDLDYLDIIFDCHNIDTVSVIKDNSLDAITLTNVLHHLKSPIDFLRRAARKLKSGGQLIATEPFFSALSTPIFKYLHHEPVNFDISEPRLNGEHGPLRTANIASPWLIFFRKPKWLERLADCFDLSQLSLRPFSALSYFMTGGISRKLPVPKLLYRAWFPLDLALSRCLPTLCASFFTVTLTRR